MAEHEATHHAAAAGKGLQRKVGPLPLWVWIVAVGGVVVYYYYTKSASSSASSTAAQLPATDAQPIPPDTGTTGGGDSGSGATQSGSGSTDSGIDPSTGLPYGQEILSAIQAQGTQDQQNPGQTFLGELSDVSGAITTLQQLFPGLFAQPGANAGKTTGGKGKGKGKGKHPGSGKAGNTGSGKKPPLIITTRHQAGLGSTQTAHTGGGRHHVSGRKTSSRRRGP